MRISPLLKSLVCAAFAATAVTSMTASMAAEAWPTRPVRLVVGFPPGGPTDIVARIVGQSLSKELGQPVIIENRGGAGGTVAAAYVAKQKPDGDTLMLTAESVQTRAAAVFRKLPYDPVADFEPIGKFAKQRVLMVVNPTLAAKDVKEFVAYAKAHPGELNYSATYSASSHFGGALFGVLNGVDLTLVNYPGGGQPITDLIAGVVQVGFFTESTVAQQVQAGKLRALAIAADERSALFPQLPTLQQAGAARMDISPWFGLVAPAKTPPEIIAKASAALTRAIASEDFEKRLAPIGAVAIKGSTPASFAADIKKEIDYWKKFVKDSNFPIVD